MKFAILSLAAAGALAVTSGTASAQPYGGHHHHHHHGGYYGSRYGGHLDYHNGHYHYHNGYYRSGPLVPVYPTYSYPSYGYGSGFNLNLGTPRFNLNLGSGYSPLYGGGYYYPGW